MNKIIQTRFVLREKTIQTRFVLGEITPPPPPPLSISCYDIMMIPSTTMTCMCIPTAVAEKGPC